MKYIKKNADGTAAVGTLKCEWGEFEFTAEKKFKDYDEAVDHVSALFRYPQKVQFRVVTESSTVPVSFLNDLCRKADTARGHRDEEAAEAGIVVHCKSHYEGHRNINLECYTSDFSTAFEYEGHNDNTTPAARRFWAEQNYLIGLADGVWELGFTLCFNTNTGKHEMRGNTPKLIVEAASESEC